MSSKRAAYRLSYRVGEHSRYFPAPAPPAGGDGNLVGGEASAWTGTWTHGSVMQFDGSGYGTKTDYNSQGRTWEGQRHLHWRFWDFNDDVLTFNAEDAQGFKAQVNTPVIGEDLGITTGGPSFNNRYAFRERINNENRGGIYTTLPNLGNGGNFFASHKFAWTGTGGKPVRFWGLCGGSSFNSFYGSAFAHGSMSYVVSTTCDTCTVNDTIYGVHNIAKDGVWHKWDFMTNASKQFRSFLNNTESAQTPMANGWCATSLTDLTFIRRTANTDPGAAGQMRGADFFICGDPIRIEIGDNATYASCTKCNIQPAVSWSSTTIQVILNQGDLSAFSGNYVFRMDGSNNATLMGQIP